MTEKLYDKDSHAAVFDATVLSCESTAKGYAVILDKTLLFPEGGGQAADEGTLGGYPVRDVQIGKDGVIRHYLAHDLPVGEKVNGMLDYDLRFQRMQLHSGEHIISGLIHQKYGFDNVGFHLGSEDVTLDINGLLEREQLEEIEMQANRIIWQNVSVKAYYPAPETLRGLTYRSKLELTENVRIVEIENVDMCACCAPHVSRTGEIGLIKLLDYIHYKGGVRIHMLAGKAALLDYHDRYCQIARVAQLMSIKQRDVALSVERHWSESEKQRYQWGAIRREWLSAKAAALPYTEGHLCLFEPGLERNDMRLYMNEAVKKCGGICAVFSWDDGSEDKDNYRYVATATGAFALRQLAKDINASLNGQGGGSDQMIQGQIKASRSEVEAFFDKLRSPDKI